MKVYIAFFIFTFFLNNSYSKTEKEMVWAANLSSKLNEIVNSFTNPPTISCHDLGQDNLKDKKITNVFDSTGQSIEISLISMGELNILFAEIASNNNIPFRWPEDGCFARAHKMSLLLEKKGIITGKVFLEGKLKAKTEHSPKGSVRWHYHVATFVAVNENGKENIYVIDPSIANSPVSLSDWKELQTNKRTGKNVKTYITQRYNYKIADKEKHLDSYTRQDIKNMDFVLEDFMDLQNFYRKENDE